MKRKMIVVLVVLSLMGVVFAESNGFTKYYTERDWYAMESALGAELPEGLTDREAEIYRAGYANGHYDALHPAFIKGLYVINTKTKKIHLSNCPNTLVINTENRLHSTLTPQELMSGALDGRMYQPCGQCHPENNKPE